MYRYNGERGTYRIGVPTRDLTDDEWAALAENHQSLYHKVETETLPMTTEQGCIPCRLKKERTHGHHRDNRIETRSRVTDRLGNSGDTHLQDDGHQ